MYQKSSSLPTVSAKCRALAIPSIRIPSSCLRCAAPYAGAAAITNSRIAFERARAYSELGSSGPGRGSKLPSGKPWARAITSAATLRMPSVILDALSCHSSLFWGAFFTAATIAWLAVVATGPRTCFVREVASPATFLTSESFVLMFVLMFASCSSLPNLPSATRSPWRCREACDIFERCESCELTSSSRADSSGSLSSAQVAAACSTIQGAPSTCPSSSDASCPCSSGQIFSLACLPSTLLACCKPSNLHASSEVSRSCGVSRSSGVTGVSAVSATSVPCVGSVASVVALPSVVSTASEASATTAVFAAFTVSATCPLSPSSCCLL
mmetsp:Transcript_118658/g.236357  ORF Transcript_118658/g.236357 Transcript_118658/m.236357 type:complete len:327 (-) Transcript_118658:114-1094(-)